MQMLLDPAGAGHPGEQLAQASRHSILGLHQMGRAHGLGGEGNPFCMCPMLLEGNRFLASFCAATSLASPSWDASHIHFCLSYATFQHLPTEATPCPCILHLTLFHESALFTFLTSSMLGMLEHPLNVTPAAIMSLVCAW